MLFTIHLISAGGLEFAVVQVRGTGSPTLASVGPDIVTCEGETENTKFNEYQGIFNFISSS